MRTCTRDMQPRNILRRSRSDAAPDQAAWASGKSLPRVGPGPRGLATRGHLTRWAQGPARAAASVGMINSQNKNSRTRVAGQVANLFVLYPMDNSTGTHALTPTTYNNLLDARAPTNNWVLLHRPP